MRLILQLANLEYQKSNSALTIPNLEEWQQVMETIKLEEELSGRRIQAPEMKSKVSQCEAMGNKSPGLFFETWLIQLMVPIIILETFNLPSFYLKMIQSNQKSQKLDFIGLKVDSNQIIGQRFNNLGCFTKLSWLFVNSDQDSLLSFNTSNTTSSLPLNIENLLSIDTTVVSA